MVVRNGAPSASGTPGEGAAAKVPANHLPEKVIAVNSDFKWHHSLDDNSHHVRSLQGDRPALLLNREHPINSLIARSSTSPVRAALPRIAPKPEKKRAINRSGSPAR